MFDEESLSTLSPSVNLELQNILKKAIKPTPTRARFEDQNIAKAFHENVAIQNYADIRNLVYATKKYADGSPGFLFPEPTSLQFRNRLLDKYYRNQYLDTSGKKLCQSKLHDNIRIARFTYAPYESFFFVCPKTGFDYVNLWVPPYWWQVQQGLVNRPRDVIKRGELHPFQQKLFRHLFRDNLPKVWLKSTLTGKANTALVLMADSRTGKTAFMQMAASLHHGNAHTSYTLSEFAGKQFAIGSLANTTFTGVNEGCIKPEYFERIKTFINNPTFDAEIKYEQSKPLTNYNSLMICSDRFDAFRGSDQALLNRLIIPHMSNKILEAGTPVDMGDGTISYFTQEEIVRVYNMSTQIDKELALSDSLVLADHLQMFEDTSINLNSRDVVGYQNKVNASNNFFENLKPWQTSFLTHFLIPAARLTKLNKHNRYVLDYETIQIIITQANKSEEFRTLVKDAATNGYNKLTENKIRELATQNAGIITLFGGKGSSFRLEIDPSIVDYVPAIENIKTSVSNTQIINQVDQGNIEQLEPFIVSEVVEILPIVTNSESNKESKIKPEIHGKFAFIDFEFHLHCKYPKLMSCSILTDSECIEEWLWNTQDYTSLKSKILRLQEENYLFVSFTDAEARCFYQLGLNPLNFKWIDCQILGYPFYHSSREFSKYANINTIPDIPYFEEELDEEEIIEQNDKSSRKKTASLIGFHNFFCKSNTDKEADVKESTRKLILSIKPNDEVGQLEKTQIMHYCSQDVEMLKELFYAQISKWTEVSSNESDVIIERFHNFTMHRIRMCDVSYNGLPINKSVYDNLCNTYAERVKQEQSKMSNFYRYEEAKYYLKDSKHGKKGQVRLQDKYAEDANLLTKYVESHNLQNVWPRTPSGKYSSSKDTLQKFSSYSEVMDYFTGKKRIKHIEFFKPDENGVPKISKYVTEEDGILLQHPEYGALGTITSRHAHKNSTFIMGMERNLRKELLGCPEGYTILQPDFSAQEVWIAGALSGDQNMLRSSFECPYLRSGMNAGIIPHDGTKDTHKAEREIFKRVVLAPLYGMGNESLSIQIRKDIETTRKFAWENRKFYSVFFEWQEEFIKNHEKTKYAELKNGWALLDNYDVFGKYRKTTTKNWPIQGHGAVIMMKVVELIYDSFLGNDTRLIYTLHDEFGILCRNELVDWVKEQMKCIMQQACNFYFPTINPPKIGFK
jgi:hypothetical protein